MAAWKKVLVEDANITVGTITATLGESTDVSTAGTVNVVVSATDGSTEGLLTVSEMAFGSNAFNSTAFLEDIPEGAYQINANTVAGEVVLQLTGNANPDSVSFEQATNSPIVITQASDAIKFDIPDATNAATGVVAAKLGWIGTMKVLGNVTGALGAVAQVSILDEDTLSSDSATALATQQSIKAYVDDATSGFGTGTVSEVTGGTNISVVDGTSTPTVNLDSTIFITKAGGVAGTGDDAAGSNIAIVGGAGTGTGTGGNIIFQTATPSGSTGSTANSFTTAMTISDDQSVTIAGDLIVNGTTTTVNSENVLLEDHFLALNNNAGTPANADSGIVFQRLSTAAALGWDHSALRFGLDFTGATQDQTALATDAFIAAVVTSDDVNYRKNGNIRVQGSEIYIYVE
jgi:hypothetical protein